MGSLPKLRFAAERVICPAVILSGAWRPQGTERSRRTPIPSSAAPPLQGILTENHGTCSTEPIDILEHRGCPPLRSLQGWVRRNPDVGALRLLT